MKHTCFFKHIYLHPPFSLFSPSTSVHLAFLEISCFLLVLSNFCLLGGHGKKFGKSLDDNLNKWEEGTQNTAKNGHFHNLLAPEAKIHTFFPCRMASTSRGGWKLKTEQAQTETPNQGGRHLYFPFHFNAMDIFNGNHFTLTLWDFQ